MSKVILSMLAAALVCVAAGNAKAANGISAETLSAMGLSSMTVMSDSEGMAIRGKGFSGHSVGCSQCDRGITAARAFGNSFATMDIEGCPDCVPIGGSSHSENGYLAVGPYYAAGTNFSEAGATFTTVESVDIGGVANVLTKTTTARVFAGGFSTASAF
jgi:hypothetical protein